MSDQQPTRQPRIPLPLLLLLMAGATAGALLAAFAYEFKWPLMYLIVGIVIWFIASATLQGLLIKQKKRGVRLRQEQTRKELW